MAQSSQLGGASAPLLISPYMAYTVDYEVIGLVAEPPALSAMLRPSEKACWAANLPVNTLVLVDHLKRKSHPARFFLSAWDDCYRLTEIIPRDAERSLYTLRKWEACDMDSLVGANLNQCRACG